MPGDGYDPDATRVEPAPSYGTPPPTPYGTPPQPGYGSGQRPPYDPGRQNPYGTGQQVPYGSPYGTGHQPPYGTPGPAAPYGGPPGYAPSGPQPPQDQAWPAGPAGPGPGGGPPGPPYGPPPGKGGKKLGLIIGGIVAAVVILGGGGTAVAFAIKGDKPPAPKPTRTEARPVASTPPPATPTPTPTTTSSGGGRWLKLASRSTDPKPLTTNEVFGHTKVSTHGRSYRQTIRNATTGCTGAVTGSRIKAAETAGACTQLLRATYLRGDGKLMGTISISNLSTYAAAHHAFEAAAGGQQFVTPLRGSGRTARLGQGAALGIRQVRGHYLILSWVQYADGHKPASTSQRKQLSAFHSDLVGNTLARPLAYRMITGRPL